MSAECFANSEEMVEEDLLAGSYENSPYAIAVRNAEDAKLKAASKKSRFVYPELVPEGTRPTLEDPVGIYISLDGLLGKSYPGAFSTALTGVESVPANPETAVKGRVIHPTVSIGVGAKVGLGLMTNRDDWEFFGEYTYFHSNTGIQSFTETEAFATTVPSFNNPLDTLSTAYIVEHNWDLILNSADLSLKRGFYTGAFATCETSLGLKGGWTKQLVKVNYTQSATPQNRNFAMSEYFSGIGPRIAMQTQLFFVKQAGAFVDFASSLLWARTVVHQTMQEADANNGPLYYTWSSADHFYNVRPTFELGLGAVVHLYNSAKTQHLELKAGWEAQAWMDHIVFANLGSANKYSQPLLIQGFNFNMRIDF